MSHDAGNFAGDYDLTSRYSDVWRRAGYVGKLVGDNLLEQPALGSSDALLRRMRAERTLWAGVDFNPPRLTDGKDYAKLSTDVQNSAGGFGPLFRIAAWAVHSLPGNRYDLKNGAAYVGRLELENAGNFAFGMLGRELGISKWLLDVAAGQVSILTAAARGSWLPWGGPLSDYYGDDPVDATYSKMGQDYQDSGQAALDFLGDPSSLPEGEQRDRALLERALRLDSNVEAQRRLGDLADTPEIAARFRDEQERRDALVSQRILENFILAERQRLALLQIEQERAREREEAAKRLAEERAKAEEDRKRRAAEEEKRRREEAERAAREAREKEERERQERERIRKLQELQAERDREAADRARRQLEWARQSPSSHHDGAGSGRQDWNFYYGGSGAPPPTPAQGPGRLP